MTATTTAQPIASRLHRIGLHVLLGAVALQLALAGGGAFGAPAWSMHVMLGMLITALAALVVVAELVARPGRTLLLGTLFVGVLALLQPLLSVLAQRVDPWFGILHAIAAVGMIAVPAVLIASRRPDRRATA